MITISYIHKNGVVHWDLKSQNILYDGKNITIIDFGIAKHFEKGKFLKWTVGTLSYMAPEVLEGNYTEKCDIWSIGIIMYILITGQFPYKGDQNQVIYKIKNYHFETNPETLDINKNIKSVLLKLLEKDYQKRPTADQVLNENWFT